jgi:hypothetical protein
METQVINATEYRNVPLALLNESTTNPRRTFEETALKELADSIRSQGILSPLLVRPLTENGFEIIAGARRYRAAQIAAHSSVPVRIVKPLPRPRKRPSVPCFEGRRSCRLSFTLAQKIARKDTASVSPCTHVPALLRPRSPAARQDDVPSLLRNFPNIILRDRIAQASLKEILKTMDATLLHDAEVTINLSGRNLTPAEIARDPTFASSLMISLQSLLTLAFVTRPDTSVAVRPDDGQS